MTEDSDPRQVFVVHGRNERIRSDIFSFLRAIGLEPIEWNKAVEMTGKAAPYVGEILDAALKKAQAIIVVMTPDDEARLREGYVKDDDPLYERELTPQPRPNVLFEAGLALGRAPERTILVKVGHIKPFSDVAGRHTIRLDNSAEKRNDLASRLTTAGCAVVLSGNDWYKEGNFEIHEADHDTSGGGGISTQTPSFGPGTATKLADDLVEMEIEILKLVGEAGDRSLTIVMAAASLKISNIKAEYFLEQLRKRDFLYGAYSYTGAPTRYRLASKGRAYLVEHDLA